MTDKKRIVKRKGHMIPSCFRKCTCHFYKVVFLGARDDDVISCILIPILVFVTGDELWNREYQHNSEDITLAIGSSVIWD